MYQLKTERLFYQGRVEDYLAGN